MSKEAKILTTNKTFSYNTESIQKVNPKKISRGVISSKK